MAKQKNLLHLTGDLDGIAFYERKGKFYARKSNPVQAERIQNDPVFQRTRENMNEFKNITGATKLLRDTLCEVLLFISDKSLQNRLVKQMGIVKNLDGTAGRGQRSVTGGLLTTAGKAAIKEFNFNSNAHLKSILMKPCTVDIQTGIFTIQNVWPTVNLAFPVQATHVSIAGAWARVDFATGEATLEMTDVVNLSSSDPVANIQLTPANTPTHSGTDFFLLLISFYQEVNGTQYVLRGGTHNVLSIIEVV